MRPTDRWRRIGELFHAALARTGDDRHAFLDVECAGDPALRAEVDGLLDAERRSGGDAFLSELVAVEAGALAAEGAASWVGRDVGRYRLLAEIARGGMGTVYLAERADAVYAARVAIKFVRGAVAGSELVRRFLAERQILADLTHPNIARLLDGGATDDGTPYLVMEHIEGVPIDVYCDRHTLSIRERLTLFLRVCEAVQHAHNRLVVHRDIKPSNILVTADGTPKLLDFGVAKLLDPAQSDAALDTGVGARLLTPAYASPEQVRGEPITTATDVYSLGVLLYRLLTGELPYGAGTLRDHALANAIVGVDPEPPSRVAARAGRKAVQFARDVDAIVLTALEKERGRRYAAVEPFAGDIRRYLDALPVTARPATRRYRLRKFLARHRGAVLAATAALTLVVGLTAIYVMRLTSERDFAEGERQKAAEVSAFLERLFKVADPDQARGSEVSAREVVDSAVARLPRALPSSPQLRAAMLFTLGGVYYNLGLQQQTRPLLERGLALRRQDAGRGSPTVGDFLSRLGEVALDLSQFDSATALLREAIRRREQEYATPDSATVSRLSLANAYRRTGRLADADSVLARTLADTQVTNDSLHQAALAARAALYLAQGRGAAAEAMAREAWQRAITLFGDDALSTIGVLSNLGQALYQQSRYADAEPVIRRVLELDRRVIGETHPRVATDWNNLAALFQAQGRHDSAVVAERHALTIYRAAYGERHERVARAMSNLGSMLLAAGQAGEAEQLDRDALKLTRAILPANHSNIAVLHNNLAHLFEEQRRYPEAEAEYRAALDVVRRGIGIRSPTGAVILANLGGVLQQEGRFTEADSSLRQALEIQRQILPAQHVSTATTLSSLGTLLVKRRRAAEAEPLLTEALATRAALLPADHWAIQVTRSALGACLADLGKPVEAEPLLTTSATSLAKRFAATDRRVRDAVGRVTRFYEFRGDTARAKAFRAEVAARVP